MTTVRTNWIPGHSQCTGDCDQGRTCTCKKLEIMPTEINQQLADYAEEHETNTPFDLMYDLAFHALVTIAVVFVVIAIGALLGTL